MDQSQGHAVRVLIVEPRADLARDWQRQYERAGAVVRIAAEAEAAIHMLCDAEFDVIVVDIDLPSGAAMAVLDFAGCRQPDANTVVVTDTTVLPAAALIAATIPRKAAVSQAEV